MIRVRSYVTADVLIPRTEISVASSNVTGQVKGLSERIDYLK